MLTLELKRKFTRLANELSPENLSCDGELSAAKVNVRRAQIMREWEKLECEAERTFTESDVWPWWLEIEEEDGRIIEALQKLAPEDWIVISENCMTHKSKCAYVQHWGPDEPYIAYCSVRDNLRFANLQGDYINNKGGSEELGRCQTQDEAIALFGPYFDTLSDDDIRAGLHRFQREEHFELAKTLRN